MKGFDPSLFSGCSPRLREPLLRCARGEAPPNVVVMQLHAESDSGQDAESALIAAVAACRSASPAPFDAAERLEAALALLRANPQAHATVKAILGGVEHGGTADRTEAGLAHWAEVFDRALRASPEGSVALYALGNPELLRAATAEVVDFLRDAGFLDPDRFVLEIGCGIGRFQAALAPEVAQVVGIDISGEMVAAARERCAGIANARFLQCSGRDLSAFGDGSFDLVLAVDSFPYLVQSGMPLADTHVREAARVLRPGGDLLILNFSYRGDAERDRRDVARLAIGSGLCLIRNGTREFGLWDGLAFHLSRPMRAECSSSRPAPPGSA